MSHHDAHGHSTPTHGTEHGHGHGHGSGHGHHAPVHAALKPNCSLMVVQAQSSRRVPLQLRDSAHRNNLAASGICFYFLLLLLVLLQPP